MNHLERTRRARSKEISIEPNQRWISVVDGRLLRRLRVLAEHPDGGWLLEDEPIGGRRERRIVICPEFNLRYMFELEAVLPVSEEK